VGGDRLARSPAVVRKGGKLVSVASEPSQEAAKARGIKVIYFVVSPNRGQLIEIAQLADAGLLEPKMAEVFPLDKAKEAFEHSLLRHGAGKIVLRVMDE
jgi:NADPH:quinone reductase-like Zn-dependent oxidoreductase